MIFFFFFFFLISKEFILRPDGARTGKWGGGGGWGRDNGMGAGDRKNPINYRV
jgi:hypothetical protein